MNPKMPIQYGALYLALIAMMFHWFIPHHEHMYHNSRYVHIVNVLSEETDEPAGHDASCHHTEHKHTSGTIHSCAENFFYLIVHGVQLASSHIQWMQPLWWFLQELGVKLAPPTIHIFPHNFLNYDREDTVYKVSYSIVYLVKSLGLRAPNDRLIAR